MTRRQVRTAISLGLVMLVLLAVALHRRAVQRDAAPTQPPTSAASDGTTLLPHRPSSAVRPLRMSGAAAVRTSGATLATFSGHVKSAASGRGLAGVDLTFSRDGTSHGCVSEADGAFRFSTREAGEYTLATVMADGYLPYAPAWGASPVRLTAELGQHIEGIVLYLEQEMRYLARVTDSDGRPLAHASARLFLPAAAMSSLAPPVIDYVADAGGRFEFRAPEDTVIEASHPGYAPAHKRLDASSAPGHEVVLELACDESVLTLLTLSGRVLDADDNPVPGARVTAHRAAGDPFADERSWWNCDSDEEGRFALTGLGSGDYALVATFAGMVPSSELVVTAGSTNAVLRLGAPGGSIIGTVRDEVTDRPVAGFVIVLSVAHSALDEMPIMAQSFFDPHGRFALGPLQPGRYRVRALTSGFAPSSAVWAEVEADLDTRIALQLRAGGAVHGRVVDASSGTPLAQAHITIEGSDGGEGLPVPVLAETRAALDGTFSLSGLAPGLRSIRVGAAGHHHRLVSGLAIIEGEELDLSDVALTPLGPEETPQHELVGIGAALAPESNVVRVGPLIPGGGAMEAGLVQGDAILAIDDTPVKTLDFNEVIQRIRGPEGSVVRLRVRRANGSETTLDVVRRPIRG
ncbi:MAG: carboxypeptidase regulatory-like domain-containing protein [Myxococcota bacterium]